MVEALVRWEKTPITECTSDCQVMLILPPLYDNHEPKGAFDYEELNGGLQAVLTPVATDTPVQLLLRDNCDQGISAGD